MSWPRAVQMCWTTFSHVVHISLVEFFSPYANIELPGDLDSPEFAFYVLEVAFCNFPEWIPLRLLEILLLLEPLPLPEPPLPLPMEVGCRQWYWPYFLLDQISPSLRCQKSSLLGLGMLSTLWLFVGPPLVSLCLELSNRIFEIVPVNKLFLPVPRLCSYQLISAFVSSLGFLVVIFTVIWRSCRF